MDAFKKWRKQRKQLAILPTETPREEPPPRYRTDPLPVSSTPALRFGLNTVHDCSDAVVDICFIHGLTGDRDKTWTAIGHTTPWPQTLLPSKLDARILMYGYDAHVTRKSVASSNRLLNHAQNLLGDLTADRSLCNASSRPLIFVAHSLGGLVCKKAILLSQNAAEPQSRELFNCLKGIVFMGTPHKGAWMADWAKIPASIFGVVKSTNTTLLDILQRDNQLLESIQVDFLTMIRRLRESGRGVEITCFFEELPFPVVGKIVTAESATLDGYDIYSIYGDHRDMVRFASEEDPGFKRLLWKLHSWTSQVGEAKKIGDYVSEEDDLRCLRDLQTTNPSDDKLRIEDTKGGLLEESYRWILSDEKFIKWQASEKGSGVLWIRGDPGRGKTMLLCGVIDELSGKSKGALSYFFCQATDANLNNATSVLRGLIYSLIEQEPSLISHVRRKYDVSGKQLFEGPNAWHALRKMFLDILDSLSDVCLIIDALDECTTGLSQLLDLLAHVPITHPHTKWIISSRSWPNIKEQLDMIPDHRRLEIELNEQSVYEAVKAFIRSRVQQLGKIKKYTSQISDAVYAHLLSNSQGTFLWVALVCAKLLKVPRVKTIEMLTAFPPGLDSLYKRMLQQVCDQEEASLYKRILGIASTVKRPITLDELVVFIDVPEDVLESDRESLDEIIGYCGSFLTISKSTIFFVHQSAKEFLLKEASATIHPDGITHQHHLLFVQSLTVMGKRLHRDIWSLGALSTSTVQAQARKPHPDPLTSMEYSCIHWVDHLLECEGSVNVEAEEQTGSLLLDFLSKKYLYWLEALGLLRHTPEGLKSMSKLQGFVQKKHPDLLNRVQDGIRFFQFSKIAIENSPLQLYSTALLFSPRQSITWSCFRQEILGGVTLSPKISHWHPCLQTLEGHCSSVSLLSISWDGAYYLSASEDGCIKLWDSTSGEEYLSLDGHCDEITSVLWSEDGNHLISASYDKTIKIWDLASGECTSTLCGHTEAIIKIVWSSDKTEVASASDDKTIKIWNRADGRCIRTLEGHSEGIELLCWISDRQLVSASIDTTTRFWTVNFWNSTTGENTLTLEGHEAKVTSVATTPGGDLLISMTNDGTEMVSRWNLSTKKPECILLLKQERLPIVSMAMSNDNKLLATNSRYGYLSIWDLSLGERLEIRKRSTTWIIWLRDGNFATLSGDSAIEIWNSSTGQRISALKGHSAKVPSATLSHNGSRLISASWDKSVKIWDLKTPVEGDMEMPEDEAKSVIASPDGKLFACVYPDKVMVWDPASGHCISTFQGHEDQIFTTTWWSADSLAIALRDKKKIMIWNSSTQECILSFEGFDAEESGWLFTSMIRPYVGSRFITASDHKDVVKIWDSATGQCLQTSKIEGYRINTACSYDGVHIATVSDDQTINVWDSSTGTLVSTLEGHRSPDEGTTVSEWRQNSKGLVQDPFSKQWIPIMEAWTVQRNAVLNTFLCWSHDGKRLVSASLKKIKVWDVTTAQCILVLDVGQHAGKIRFSESNPNILQTSIGFFDLGPSLANGIIDTAQSIISCRPNGYGFSADRVWITFNGDNFLWMPPDYRPGTLQQTEVHGKTVVISCVTGRILILKFPDENSSLG